MSDRLPPTCGEFTIEVKPKHYREADTGSASQCVLAVALRATFPDLEGVSVQLTSAHLDHKFWHHDAKALVDAFDEHQVTERNAPPVTPVTFTRGSR